MRKRIDLPRSAEALLAVFELDKEPATAYLRLILARRHDGEYVVSSQSGEPPPTATDELVDNEIRWSGSWNQGHYFENLEEARDYFVERCRQRR